MLDPVEVVQALGYKTLSGASRVRLSALKKYGLLDKKGNGVALSPRAIVLAINDPGTEKYATAARAAINSVGLFADLLRDHSNSSEQIVRNHLIEDREFTRDGAGRATDAFFSAKALIGSLAGGIIEGNDDPDRDSDAEIGPDKYVQWVSGGVAQFQQPRRVESVEEHDDGEAYAKIAADETGGEGWAPMSELELADPPKAPPLPAPPARHAAPTPPPKGAKRATLPLDSGPVTIEWPDSLTLDDYEDIKAWLTILERKIGRSADNSATDDD